MKKELESSINANKAITGKFFNDPDHTSLSIYRNLTHSTSVIGICLTPQKQ